MERFEFLDGSYYEFDPAELNIPEIWATNKYRNFAYHDKLDGLHSDTTLLVEVSTKLAEEYTRILGKEYPDSPTMDTAKAEEICNRSKLQNTPGEVNKRIVGVVVVGNGYNFSSVFPKGTILPVQYKTMYYTHLPRFFVDLDNWQGKLIMYNLKKK